MPESFDAGKWVYVLVQNSGRKEQIVGQHDAEKDVAFIPAFPDKDSAYQGVVHMAKEKGQKYEIQAIILEDLLRYAAEGRFLVFILDGQGTILRRFSPDQNQRSS